MARSRGGSHRASNSSLVWRPTIQPVWAPASVWWLAAVQACLSWLAGLQASGLVAVAGRAPRIDEYRFGERTVRIEDAAVEEIAAALRWSPCTARVRIDAARELVGPLSALHAALLEGRVTAAHAAAISTRRRRDCQQC